MGYTTPNTVSGSDTLTAALWNTQIRDNFESLPRGVVGRAQSITNQTGIGAPNVDVTGLTVTWTATASRLYLTTVFFQTSQSAVSATMTALICNQSNGLYQQFMTYVNATSTNPVFMQVYETGLSGSQTRKARVAVTGGTMQVNGDITYPNQILVQDIGPA
jgi:hypothetical protein